MKVRLYMAISVNGIIARENGEEDFLSEKNWDTFVELLKESKALIWGRKTYEIVMQEYGEKYLETIKDIKKLIVSSDENLNLDRRFELTKSPDEALNSLKRQGFNEVLISGGSFLNSSFAKKKIIDEIIFNIEPTIVGYGIPVFSPEEFDLKLSEPEMRQVSEGIIQLRYKVL